MPPVVGLADASMKINGYACRLILRAWFDCRVAPSSCSHPRRDGRLKSRHTFANSLDCGPSLSLATTDGELFLPPTVLSTPRAIPIVRSPQGNSILLQVGTAGAYLGLPPPKRQHSSGDCLIRLAACALLAINRRLTNHRPHRRGGGVEAEVDRVAFDTSFHHGFSTG